MHISFGEYGERLWEIRLYVAHVSTEAGISDVKFVIKR